MLRHTINYVDFDDKPQTATFYFNLTKAELLEMEVEHKGGFGEWIDAIVKAEDEKTLMAEIKRTILLAYGEKSPDGQRFIKSDEIREGFVNHAAYDALIVELATTEDASANFFKGLLPKDLVASVEATIKSQEEAAKTQTAEVAPAPPIPNQ